MSAEVFVEEGANLRAAQADEKRASDAGMTGLRDDPHDVLPDFPTKEEMATLRRVPNKIPLKLYTIAFIEMCERFSYYGSTVVCKLTKANAGGELLSSLYLKLTRKSHQLYPAAATSWLDYWRAIVAWG